MTVVTNMHKTSFIFTTYVMSLLWRCHVSLMHTPSSSVTVCFPWYCCLLTCLVVDT